jgi:disulfide bond formation protein DsbB
MSTASPSGLHSSRWTWAALVVSLIAGVGSLYLSMGMKLQACPLCFYQRAFMLGTFAVLATGLFAGLGRTVSLGLLAFPLAIAGLAIAGTHVNLERTGTLECPIGVLGLGTAPQQSLASFILLALILFIDCAQSNVRSLMTISVAMGLGFVLAIGCLNSNPPPEDAPKKPHEGSLIKCRRPYFAPE